MDSHFTSPGHISSAAPSSSLLGLLHTPCLQPIGAKPTVLPRLVSPDRVKTQTGFSFFSSMVPRALCCFPPSQGTPGTKHCKGHLGSVLKGTLLPHLGPTPRAEQRLFQDLKRKEEWLPRRTSAGAYLQYCLSGILKYLQEVVPSLLFTPPWSKPRNK